MHVVLVDDHPLIWNGTRRLQEDMHREAGGVGGGLAVPVRARRGGRQREVLALALQGLPNKSIARRPDIAEGTVKVHLPMVYRALGVTSRVSALCRVLQAGAAQALG
ncbi:helix-turn-helix transcriptional regulator [Pseudorhodoferax sp. LjRoot39]|uniref:LuxR C-terminal-related transcriptional regulator n=1 Tax=Pseudorhodoferax sp. LjRoot39 TaxID=3342328 RepID=UPI003ED06037